MKRKECNPANWPGAARLDGIGALELIWSGDANLFAIVGLSLFVTLSATILASLVGMPLGALVALTRFPGRNVLIVLLNGSMGLPPVVVGLVVFLLLSRSGPLGPLGILFTPQAMIVAQAVLIAPIIAALTRQVIEDLWAEYREELTAMDVGRSSRVAHSMRIARRDWRVSSRLALVTQCAARRRNPGGWPSNHVHAFRVALNRFTIAGSSVTSLFSFE